LVEALEGSGIPYQVSGEKPLAEYPLVNDVLSILRSTSGDPEQKRISDLLDKIEIRSPIGELIAGKKEDRDVFERLKRIATLYEDYASFSDYILLQQSEDGGGVKGEKVSLLTLHAAKGLEFPVVFITGCENGLIPLERESRQIDSAEERRLFYVGMTRAKSRLYLVLAKLRLLYGKTFETAPSPYLADIKEELKTYDKTRRLKKTEKKPESEQVSLFDWP
jgi:superfamily I DNA/RNA helicase